MSCSINTQSQYVVRSGSNDSSKTPSQNCQGVSGESSSENYIHASQAPWTRPTAYLNLNQTWNSQKSFQL